MVREPKISEGAPAILYRAECTVLCSHECKLPDFIAPYAAWTFASKPYLLFI